MDDRLLPNELRLVAKTKLKDVPHAEVLLRAAKALEERNAPQLVDMPLLLESGDGFLRIPWPMTARDFKHLKKMLVGLHDIYSWVGDQEEGATATHPGDGP